MRRGRQARRHAPAAQVLYAISAAVGVAAVIVIILLLVDFSGMVLLP